MRDTKTVPELRAITMADLVGVVQHDPRSEIELAVYEYLVSTEDDGAFVAACKSDRTLALTCSDLPVIDDEDSAVPRYIEPETTMRATNWPQLVDERIRARRAA